MGVCVILQKSPIAMRVAGTCTRISISCKWLENPVCVFGGWRERYKKEGEEANEEEMLKEARVMQQQEG